MIQKNVCKADIFSVISEFFDTRLKILTPAPLVVLVTNIRYASEMANWNCLCNLNSPESFGFGLRRESFFSLPINFFDETEVLD